ncbi:transposase, partial [Enterococcus faecium]|uniref:transposase n=1 Tax=Enterococcus faecium TaxID=1352 RepID=UPI00292CD627
KDVSFTVHSGEVVGFIGPNGSGKSTTIRTLLGIIKKDGGTATREAVQLIVIDMYAPYVSLVKKLFPNAQLIIDRFHIVQHIGR